MFVRAIYNALYNFANQTLQVDTNLMSNCARFNLNLEDYYLAQAINTFFQLANPSDDYMFSYDRDRSDRSRGYVSICGRKTEGGSQVNPNYIKQLKDNLIRVGKSLSENWTQYHPSNDDSDFNVGLIDYSKYETIMSKPASEGTWGLYEYLNKQSGSLITVGGDDNNVIAGSINNINTFLNYLKRIGNEIQYELSH